MIDPSGRRADHDALPPPRRCALFTPGHTVHFIQARHGWERRVPQLPGRLVAVEGNLVVVQVGEREVRLRNHEAERLRIAAERCGGEIGLQERLRLLQVPGGTAGGHLFSVAGAHEQWRECIVDDDWPRLISKAEQLKLILDRGGGYFTPRRAGGASRAS